ncbi:hypothetical protein J7L05_02310 [bacterium]|nr:hypothetical protein [bacterium]
MTNSSLKFNLEEDPKITFLTGAGISSESGIPTFRGEKGLWEKFDIEKYATLEGFNSDPKAVWEWYDMRRTQAKESKPNKAHEVIAKLEQAGYDVVVITQNIDNLHRDAGSENIIELHGNIWHVRCTRSCPAAGMAEMALNERAHVVELNLEETPITQMAHESHFGKAAEILPQLFGDCIE